MHPFHTTRIDPGLLCLSEKSTVVVLCCVQKLPKYMQNYRNFEIFPGFLKPRYPLSVMDAPLWLVLHLQAVRIIPYQKCLNPPLLLGQISGRQTDNVGVK